MKLTIDACVWGHARNPKDPNFHCATQLLELVLDLDVTLVYDSNGHLEAECDAQIGASPGLPAEAWAALLSSGRVEHVDPSTLHRDHVMWVNGQIRSSKPRDRTLLKVGLIHRDTIATDDGVDFHASLRKLATKMFGLSILTSCESLDILRPD